MVVANGKEDTHKGDADTDKPEEAKPTPEDGLNGWEKLTLSLARDLMLNPAGNQPVKNSKANGTEHKALTPT
ncbi:hypothetical protein D3C85_1837430 [compost metagenome]